MQKRTINIVMAIVATASLLLVLAPGVSLGAHWGMGHKSGSGNRTGWNIDEMYATVLITGMNDQSVNYNILNTAIKGKDGQVGIMNFTTPVSVTYYISNDTAVFPAKNREGGHRDGGQRQRHVRSDYSNATISPAGASAIIAMKNFTTVKRDNVSHESQFTGMSVYLPDGSVKSYTLKTPVKIVGNKQNRSMYMVGNAEYRADLQDALKGGGKFPAGAPAVTLKAVDGVK